jgi:N-succinyldiaminopimelate aminotransferase
MKTSSKLAPFGSTIFSDITRRAVEAGAINLGQGFPNFDGPGFVKEAAIAAIRAGHGQYAPTSGIPELTSAIAARF